VDPADLLGAVVVDEARAGLREAPGWHARFAVLDAVLTRVLRDGEVAPGIAYAFGRVLRGGVSVAGLAEEVGWSARYLTDRFRAEFGLRPEEAARVARFDRARRALRPAARLADVAAGHGFADQSHLVREFHAFAGCTPTRWMADEFVSVLAPAAADEDDRPHD
jgi:AraC-like DNA-binding protein